ncbi:MAG: hypothetical protein J0M18_20835 [Ignavibacteria bacterium]|jgi:hypothetical protein|nr:hypothetical protein [Ignavibacteria bacterium]
MVEVFKTNVGDKLTADKITAELQLLFGGNINFDLDDCDKILRVEGDEILPEKISEVLTCKGFICEILD